MVFSSCKRAAFSWVLILMAVLPIPASIERLKQDKTATPGPRPTLDTSDSRILWQFNTGG
jgi:hypothetical protein